MSQFLGSAWVIPQPSNTLTCRSVKTTCGINYLTNLLILEFVLLMFLILKIANAVLLYATC